MKLSDLATHIDARLIGDGDVEVTAVKKAALAGPGDLGFAAHAVELRAARTTNAAALLVPEAFAADHAHELPCPVLAAPQHAAALARAVHVLHPPAPRATGVDPRAAVDNEAVLERDVAIGPFAVVGKARVGAGAVIGALAYVGDDVVVGPFAIVGPGAVLMQGVELGARVVVGPGAVVGNEGFVYAPHGTTNVRVRHTGSVLLQSDVELGANTIVDRGALSTTTIKRGAKLDALVQVGHDVVVGEDAVLIGGVGVAGDTTIGDRAVLAGHAGVKDHVRIGDDVRVGGGSGVTRDVDDGAAVSGYPAIPHLKWLKAMALVGRLDELERRVRALEKETRT